MGKKLLCLLLCLTVLLGAVPAVSAAGVGGFSDVSEGQWFTPAVKWAAEKGLVNGFVDGTFKPYDPLTREQFCQILAKAKGLPYGTNGVWWAATAVESVTAGHNDPAALPTDDWCGVYGWYLTQGDYSGIYRRYGRDHWAAPIPREEAIFAVTRAFYYKTYSASGFTARSPLYNSCGDKDTVSPRYSDNLAAAYALGVTRGVDDQGTFAPQGQLSRGQICQLLMNVMEG